MKSRHWKIKKIKKMAVHPAKGALTRQCRGHQNQPRQCRGHQKIDHAKDHCGHQLVGDTVANLKRKHPQHMTRGFPKKSFSKKKDPHPAQRFAKKFFFDTKNRSTLVQTPLRRVVSSPPAP